jgi:hypothetical protein
MHSFECQVYQIFKLNLETLAQKITLFKILFLNQIQTDICSLVYGCPLLKVDVLMIMFTVTRIKDRGEFR